MALMFTTNSTCLSESAQDGKTPLHVAAHKGFPNIARLLIRAVADLRRLNAVRIARVIRKPLSQGIAM